MGAKTAIGLGLLALVGSGVYVISVGSRDDRSAGRGAAGVREVAFERASVTGLRLPATAEGTRDGVSLGGRLVVATAAGLRTPGEPHITRFGRAEVTAVTAQGGTIILGAADGSVTVVPSAADGEEAAEIRFAGQGAVTELAVEGDRLYVGTEHGLIVWDGERATAPAGVGPVTAMAAGPEGVAIGTAGGQLFRARGARIEAMEATLDDRVTALAWDGDSLLAGTPFALLRITGAHVRTVRNDVNVTAILVEGARIYLGTFDDGVVRLEADGREHRLVGREHVRRLRWIGGRPVAFGDGGAWDLSGPAAQRLV
jgi:hypothetical protein